MKHYFTKPHPNKKFVLLFSSIPTILLITLVFYLSKADKSSDFQYKAPIIHTPTTITGKIANSLGNENLQNWKTYTGKNYRFRYPQDWEISRGYADIENSIMISNKKEGDELIAAFIAEGSNYGIDATLEARKEGIGNYVWNVRYSACCGEHIERLYTIGDINKDTNFTFSFTLPKQFPKTYSIVDQILSTFKFIDNTTNNISCKKDEDCFCHCCQRIIEESKLNEVELTKECPLYSKSIPYTLVACVLDLCYKYEKDYIPKCINNSCIWEKR